MFRYCSRLIAFIIIVCSNQVYAQKEVTVVSFYLDREVDFSLMKMFSDDSEDKIRQLMEDPEFNLAPLINDFHAFVLNEFFPKVPFEISPEGDVLSSEAYQALKTELDEEETKLHEPFEGYLKLGKEFDDPYLAVIKDQSSDGLMLVDLKFFVRKNGLKTVIQAQVEMDVRNAEGKRAWKYLEFGLSPEGIKTFSGFVVSKQDEVMPMFTSAVDNLKEKMLGNVENRSKNATKKL